ncbi:MAG TPA: porin [Allosphingosinicella sp.]|nr:porin [Allosphingosinicella sp.]
MRAIGTAGTVSLLATALLLVPALAAPTQRTSQQNRMNGPVAGRPLGAFTPAVSDSRLGAMLRRQGNPLAGGFSFTPSGASNERPNRGLRVAVRARANTPVIASADVGPSSSSAVTAITPSSYNLGVSVGWRRFAISGDVAQNDSGLISGVRESARVGISYQPTRRITGRVAVGAERADGAQRIIAEDEAYSLDVGGAYRITRNIDLTAGARYRISRDRLDPTTRDDRRDSQAVYVGTAFRF